MPPIDVVGHIITFVASIPSLALLSFLLFVAVALPHELGHAAAGKLVGFGFRSLHLLGVGVTHGRRGWRIDLSKAPVDQASCCMSPADVIVGTAAYRALDIRALRRRYAVVALGGPVVGLVATAAYAIAAAFVAASHASSMAQFLSAAAVGGLCVNAVSLIPVRTKTRCSDAYHARNLLRGGPMADRYAAYLTVARSDRAGYSFDRLEPELLRLLTLPAAAAKLDAQFEVAARAHAYFWSSWIGDINVARQLLTDWEGLTRQPNGDVPPNVAFERAYFAAIHDDDPAAARRSFGLVPTTVRLPALRARAEAAICLAAGDYAEAAHAAERGLALKAALERADWHLARIALRDLNALLESARRANPERRTATRHDDTPRLRFCLAP